MSVKFIIGAVISIIILVIPIVAIVLIKGDKETKSSEKALPLVVGLIIAVSTICFVLHNT